MKKGAALYVLLFVAYLIASGSSFVSIPSIPWLSHAGQWAPAFLFLLLVFVVWRGEASRSALQELLASVTKTISNASTASQNIDRQVMEVKEIRSEIDNIRRLMRSDDVMLQGRFLFYQGRYDQAASVFRDAVDSDEGNRTKHARWAQRSFRDQRVLGNGPVTEGDKISTKCARFAPAFTFNSIGA